MLLSHARLSILYAWSPDQNYDTLLVLHHTFGDCGEDEKAAVLARLRAYDDDVRRRKELDAVEHFSKQAGIWRAACNKADAERRTIARLAVSHAASCEACRHAAALTVPGVYFVHVCDACADARCARSLGGALPPAVWDAASR